MAPSHQRSVRFAGQKSTGFVLTILKIGRTINIEHLFGFVVTKEDCVMSENEMKLLEMVRENDNPDMALMAAATIILGYLKQHESSEEQAAAYL